MSAFVPGFENDLFISYAHADDPAWIAVFEKSLGEEVARRLGLGVSVWQDARRLRAGMNWQTEIESGVQRSAVLIAVVSPCYENSDWCKRERDLFRQLFTTQDAYENANRVFKAVKTPWENDDQLRFLKPVQNLDFFRREEGPVGHLEFLPGSDDFRIAVGSLARAVGLTLGRLRRERQRVFVATPAKDCLDLWTRLRGELSNRGYDVQPHGPRGDDFADDLIRGEMDHSLLSVHLLGAAYDPFVERQIRLAAELEQRLTLWLTPTTATADADQTRLIDALRDGKRPDRQGVALPARWMLLPESLTLQGITKEILAALEQAPTGGASPPANGASRVYIVHDATTADDAQVAADLRSEIVKREGMSVFLSRADLPSAAQRQWHEKLLQTCEGVLLCRSSSPQRWLMEVAPDVIFAEKLMQRGPLKSRAFLVPEPAPWSGIPNLQAIPYGPQFQVGDLEPFLAPLRAQGAAADAT